jgi:hypothetical protein
MGFKSFRVTASYSQHLMEVAASITLLKSSHSRGLEGDSEAELSLSSDGVYDYGPHPRRVCLSESAAFSRFQMSKFYPSVPNTIQSVNWHQLFQHRNEITTIRFKGWRTSGLLQSLASSQPTNVPSGCRAKKGKGKRDNNATYAPAQAANIAASGSHAFIITTVLSLIFRLYRWIM